MTKRELNTLADFLSKHYVTHIPNNIKFKERRALKYTQWVHHWIPKRTLQALPTDSQDRLPPNEKYKQFRTERAEVVPLFVTKNQTSQKSYCVVTILRCIMTARAGDPKIYFMHHR